MRFIKTPNFVLHKQVGSKRSKTKKGSRHIRLTSKKLQANKFPMRPHIEGRQSRSVEKVPFEKKKLVVHIDLEKKLGGFRGTQLPNASFCRGFKQEHKLYDVKEENIENFDDFIMLDNFGNPKKEVKNEKELLQPKDEVIVSNTIEKSVKGEDTQHNQTQSIFSGSSYELKSAYNPSGRVKFLNPNQAIPDTSP